MCLSAEVLASASRRRCGAVVVVGALATLANASATGRDGGGTARKLSLSLREEETMASEKGVACELGGQGVVTDGACAFAMLNAVRSSARLR